MKTQKIVADRPQVQAKKPLAPIVLRMAGAIAYTGLSRSALYSAMRAGELQRVKLTAKAVGFTIDELNLFIKRRIAATPRMVGAAHIEPPEVQRGIHPLTR